MPRVNHIGHLLDDVGHAGAIARQHFFELAVGVPALRNKIAGVHDLAALFVLGTDAGQKDHFRRPSNGHRFGKAAFGPTAVIEMMPFESLLF